MAHNEGKRYANTESADDAVKRHKLRHASAAEIAIETKKEQLESL